MDAYENVQASESRIRDADMAEEVVNFTTHQILTQSGIAMLAQAGVRPHGVLQLLR
jgi:flagellin